MLAGVTITDPSSTFIDVDVRIGEDTTIEPYSFLRGQVEIGLRLHGRPDDHADRLRARGRRVGRPLLPRRLRGARRLHRRPVRHIRPGTKLHERAKAGSFVEIKNSEIGAGAKVPHLSYLGDADLGEGTNIGAGHDHRQLRRPPASTAP